MNRLRVGAAWAVVVALSLPTAPLVAQSQSGFLIAGYGSTTYEGATQGEYRNNFSASVSPVLLYSKGSDFLFEAELEFGLSGEATSTTLEYAQIDYLGLDNIQLIAGKFLIPFGIFGERLHPTWINKLPTSPIVFGHAHGGVAEGSLLPVMTDAGFMMRWAQPMGSSWALDFSGYVTQGPRLADEEADGHDHGDAGEIPSVGVAPQVALGVAFGDNNKNKMLGGRLGVVNGGGFELYGSGFHAMYDDESFLDFYGGAVSAEWRAAGFELRSEVAKVWQEFPDVAEGDYETLVRAAAYVQGSYRFESLEPVVRWGWLRDATVEGSSVQDGHNELAIGLVYWVDPTLPLKAAWEYHQDRPDQFALQWAFGF